MRVDYRMRTAKKLVVSIFATLIISLSIYMFIASSYYTMFLILIYSFMLFAIVVKDIKKILFYNIKNVGIVHIDDANGEMTINAYGEKRQLKVDFENAVFKKKVIEFNDFDSTYQQGKQLCNRLSRGGLHEEYANNTGVITRYFLNEFELPINDIHERDIQNIEKKIRCLSTMTPLRFVNETECKY